MCDEEVDARLQALKRTIERARAEREVEERKRQAAVEQQQIADRFEHMVNTKYGGGSAGSAFS